MTSLLSNYSSLGYCGKGEYLGCQVTHLSEMQIDLIKNTFKDPYFVVWGQVRDVKLSSECVLHCDLYPRMFSSVL